MDPDSKNLRNFLCRKDWIMPGAGRVARHATSTGASAPEDLGGTVKID